MEFIEPFQEFFGLKSLKQTVSAVNSFEVISARNLKPTYPWVPWDVPSAQLGTFLCNKHLPRNDGHLLIWFSYMQESNNGKTGISLLSTLSFDIFFLEELCFIQLMQ